MKMITPINVQDLVIPPAFRDRYNISNEPWSELFTNGVPKSCSFMLTAEPGAGKTTFMLSFAQTMAMMKKRALYITTEQSVYDIKMMCERIGVNNIDLLESSKIQDVIKNISKYQMVVLDSFACLEYKNNSTSTRNKDLEKLRMILNEVHKNECVFVMIQHITKNGTYKGSTYLAHMVDVVMHMEITDPATRLFNVLKNRYGCCKEYEMIMSSTGLSCGSVDATSANVGINTLAANCAPKGIPNGCTKITDAAYRSRTGHYYLITAHGIKYVHSDRMDKLLEKNGTIENVIKNYRIRKTS